MPADNRLTSGVRINKSVAHTQSTAKDLLFVPTLAAPGTVLEGSLYFDTTDKGLYFGNGTTNIKVAQLSSGTGVRIADANDTAYVEVDDGTVNQKVTAVASAVGVDAIHLDSTNAAGGIQMDAGTAGVQIISSGANVLWSTSTTADTTILHQGGVGSDLNIECAAGIINIDSAMAGVPNAVLIEASGAVSGITLRTNGEDITTIGGSIDITQPASGLKVQSVQVVGSQQPAVADCVVAADGTSAGTQLNLLLAALRLHGLILT